jgi:predicted HTH domain antitoxin
MSRTLEIEMPEDVLLAMQQDPDHFVQELRLAASVKWYEMGVLSQGKAAEAAGLSRAAFIGELARFGVSPLQETAGDILDAVKGLSK